MRVISGYLKGLNFDSPKNYKIHPMSEKIRGSLFNTLGDIEGLTLLDTFSGSGSLSYEAISRGAKQCVAIDVSKLAVENIKLNCKKLDIGEKLEVYKSTIATWSINNQDKIFDLIIADPPYNDTQILQLNKLGSHLKKSGTLVLSWPGKLEPINLIDLKVVKYKNYGDSQLVFYHKIS
ncbi:MAG TPA: RsmD family RNA methyltransferase [Patescibacteria group bacterium]|nr:RsmD family RNA methyltransferase [Patescibacteria group bacterium]